MTIDPLVTLHLTLLNKEQVQSYSTHIEILCKNSFSSNKFTDEIFDQINLDMNFFFSNLYHFKNTKHTLLQEINTCINADM